MGKHCEWRKVAKKVRRQKRRQAAAEIRDKNEDEEHRELENSPSYKQRIAEEEAVEEFNAAENVRLAKEGEARYLEREKQAQIEWEALQKKIAFAREERAKQIAKIKDEWDREQKRQKAIKEEKLRAEEEQKQKQEALQKRVEEFFHSNAEMPDELNLKLESNPGKLTCPFFKKTASCRFNDACSRNHIRPTISTVLLFRNFYSHYSLEQRENEYGADSLLEFENEETYGHFKEFFNDVLLEFEKCGTVLQIKICCNMEPHLRGNVYVEYSSKREAMRSYRVFQGRWYASRQINVEFCEIESWKAAICGLFFVQRCPKGSVCNFLHVFRNPGNLFHAADKDLHRTPIKKQRTKVHTRSWKWSESEGSSSDWSDTERNSNSSRKKRRSYKDRSIQEDKNRVINSRDGGRSKSDRKRRHRSKSPLGSKRHRESFDRNEQKESRRRNRHRRV